MSIRVRRGTDTQRLSVILEEGEIAYTTDTKKFYVGDGITLGGTEIGGGTVASVTASSPLSSSGGANPNITIQDALADGSTKGAASFNASDFNASSGVISIDYTNGQSASGISKGFLTSADWTAFNNKLDPFPVGNFAELTSSVLNITGGSSSIIGAGITVEVKQSSATQGGYLSSADWSTFNGKQNALTNPVTGTGTNNEIAFFNTTGSTIGSLSTATYPSLTELSYVKGATSSIQTQLNGKQGSLTLTTTGTSGASTLVGNTLNIPQYSGGGGGTSVNFQVAFNNLGSAMIGYNIANPYQMTVANEGMGSQQIYFIAYHLPSSATITGVKWYQGIKGNYTASNYNGVGLYSYSSGTLTLVASSTNDGSTWSTPTTGTFGSKAFSSSYSASAGTYYIALLYSSSAVVTGPQIGRTTSYISSNSTAIDFTNSAGIGFISLSQTALPSSIAASSLFRNNSIYSTFLY